MRKFTGRITLDLKQLETLENLVKIERQKMPDLLESQQEVTDFRDLCLLQDILSLEIDRSKD